MSTEDLVVGLFAVAIGVPLVVLLWAVTFVIARDAWRELGL